MFKLKKSKIRNHSIKYHTLILSDELERQVISA